MSTIAARRLDCRVRNENGYDPPAKPPELNTRSVRYEYTIEVSPRHTRESSRSNIEHAKDISPEGLRATNDRAAQNSARETGHISTPRLNTLLCFHLEPINLVISEVPHNDF